MSFVLSIGVASFSPVWGCRFFFTGCYCPHACGLPDSGRTLSAPVGLAASVAAARPVIGRAGNRAAAKARVLSLLLLGGLLRFRQGNTFLNLCLGYLPMSR